MQGGRSAAQTYETFTLDLPYETFINMYLYVSLCIFMYLFVSDVSLYTYLYVSFKTVPEDTYVSLHLYVSFKTVPEDTYESLRIFMYFFNRFRKIHKDT